MTGVPTAIVGAIQAPQTSRIAIERELMSIRAAKGRQHRASAEGKTSDAEQAESEAITARGRLIVRLSEATGVPADQLHEGLSS